MVEITLRKGEPEYTQIVQQITWAVASGQLKPGDRLEPVRALARRLRVNPSTVARAYRLLEVQGVIETHQRRGSLIRGESDSSVLREARQVRLRLLMERPLVEALAQGFGPEEIEAAFGLQLAAWQERRRGQAPTRGPVEDSSRLSRFAGSHDYALEALWAQARLSHPDAALAVIYVGSLDGLLKLLHGEVGLAGCHLLDEETGEYNLPILRRLFVGHRLCVMTLAEREQGMIVAPGNPKGLRNLSDLVQPGIRFINRQVGSGTRSLLDHQLKRQGISPQALRGYDQQMMTHSAVAQEVARGAADAGLGLRAAAQAFGLDFIPLAYERYDLVLLAQDRRQSPLDWLLDSVASPAFKAMTAQLPGYSTTHSGHETYL